MVERQSVTSSYVKALGHDPEANELHVEWPSGKVSIYSDVNAQEFHDILTAQSVGRAVIAVKNTRSHRYAG